MLDSVETFTAGLVDYAGLFPPAGLNMRDAALNYRRYMRSDDVWMLGRFVLPLSRLNEFEQVAAEASLLPTEPAEEPWRITALLPPVGEINFNDVADRLAAFNEAHGSPAAGAAVIDTVETKAETTAMVEDALDRLPDEYDLFLEFAAEPDPRGLIAALAGTGGRAKIRTGGVKAEMIPAPEAVARFIAAASASEVGFKATAGLHHAARGLHPLTYEQNSPSATMHGFVNVFFVGCALATGLADESLATDALREANIAAFRFDEHGVSWRDVRLDNEHIALARERFALSFGSCSFEEPVGELREVGLI